MKEKINNLGMSSGSKGLIAVKQWSDSVTRITQEERATDATPTFNKVKMPIGIHFM